jgi:glucose dehydrogenase
MDDPAACPAPAGGCIGSAISHDSRRQNGGVGQSNSAGDTAGADWARSNGDNAASRFSSLDQINRRNVKDLQVAWTYHSGDGKGGLEANPVIVNGVLYGPTPGGRVVALDAATGRELWRFQPDGRPAFRGLVYWSGRAGYKPRVYFPPGDWSSSSVFPRFVTLATAS